ncbi:hypothetical protein CWM61_24510 [Klebsiella sp. K-Nf6]|nr:hypothetical protein CWM61_24510 [Klebsiella sp. K-Nf6]
MKKYGHGVLLGYWKLATRMLLFLVQDSCTPQTLLLQPNIILLKSQTGMLPVYGLSLIQTKRSIKNMIYIHLNFIVNSI